MITNLVVAIVAHWCICDKCCRLKVTSLGSRPVVGRTIAAPRSIPLGSQVLIEGVGLRTVETRAAKRYDHRFDVFVKTHAEAKRRGISTNRIWIIQP